MPGSNSSPGIHRSSLPWLEPLDLQIDLLFHLITTVCNTSTSTIFLSASTLTVNKSLLQDPRHSLALRFDSGP
jgi:hypothetical protein